MNSGTEVADRDEPIDVRHLRLDQIDRSPAILRRQAVEKQLFTLQRDEHRPLEGALQRPAHRDQQ
jgi:hypothetical protein